ncbi:hypothetical protein [Nocardia sp. NPDC020380]|uniref:hypothetical protein n=1 Tax=Nocardia sp. NPDC020380 TaxID=3364309 RepID=UPI0037B8CD04
MTETLERPNAVVNGAAPRCAGKVIARVGRESDPTIGSLAVEKPRTLKMASARQDHKVTAQGRLSFCAENKTATEPAAVEM